MVTIRKANAALMDRPTATRSASKRAVSPRTQERLGQERQFARLISNLNDPSQVFEVKLGPDEKPLTIRQRLLKVARGTDKEIAVRKHGEGFLVGLMTPDRRTRRGRRAGGSRTATADTNE